MALHPNFIGPVNRLQKISTNLRALDTKTQKSIMRDQTIYDAMGHDSAQLLENVIKQETSSLTWGKGRQTSYGDVSYAVRQNASSSRLIWEGQNIALIEYGAGVHAVENPYPGGPTIDYSPIEDGRYARSGERGEGSGNNWSGKTNQAWYFNAGGNGNLGSAANSQYNTVTRGWAPIAPFYKTMQLMRQFNAKQLNYTSYRKAVKVALKKQLEELWRGDKTL